MMTGYHNQPRQTAAAEWFDAAGKRFIRTGDVGRFDEDGFLVLLDRKKDMIISGGFNVYPSDLEAVLREHPAVARSRWSACRREHWGETPVAFVVPRRMPRSTPARCATGPTRAWARLQRLQPCAWSGELPRSHIGKVLKRELREAWGRGPGIA